MKKTIALILCFIVTSFLVSAAPPIARSFWSQNGNSKLNGQAVPVGTVITAYDPDGILCGQYTVATAGQFTFDCVGDDPDTGGDEGGAPGNIITFYMDGVLATVVSGSAEWQSGYQEVNIEASSGPQCTDNDQDGYGNPGDASCTNGAATDCNDADVNVNPGATESCNNIDDNCNGQTDESLTRATTCGQGACTGNTGQETCTAGDWGGDTCNPFAGATPEVCEGSIDEDCDGVVDDGCACTPGTPRNCPLQAGVCAGSQETCTALGQWPGCTYTTIPNYEATEVSCDTLDNDCDGNADVGLTTTYYQDLDSDTYGNAAVTQQACTQPSSHVLDNTDCNDNNVAVNPGATEDCTNGIDDDCDSLIDGNDPDCQACTSGQTRNCPLQAGVCAGSQETCTALGQWPGCVYTTIPDYQPVEENAVGNYCDNIDNDCDASVDESITRPSTCGVGACAGNTGQETCTASLWGDNTCNPFAGATAEICDNAIDDDCDGFVDLADINCQACTPAATRNCQLQAGVCAGSQETCDAQGQWPGCTYTTIPNYEATEVSCDTLDNDCNGTADIGLTTAYYQDTDSDTYGNATVTQQACTQPVGYVLVNTDCNDNSAAVNPGATELCANGIDDDCDGLIDATDPNCQACTSGTSRNCPLQSGVCAGSFETCNAQSQWPGCTYTTIPNYEATEVSCDTLDNDCNGTVDVGLTTTYYQDTDSDTYGNAAVTLQACTQPAGYALVNTDCNDNNAAVNPGAAEACTNGIDDECDSLIDGNDPDCQTCTPGTSRNCPLQNGVCAGSQQTCTALGQWTACVYTTIPDYQPVEENAVGNYCDNIDNDCDGSVDETLTTVCGTGACAGTQTCTIGSWGTCSTENSDAGICAICDASGNPLYDGTQDSDCACPTDGCTDENSDGIIDAFNDYNVGACQAINSCNSCGPATTEPDERCITAMKIPMEQYVSMFSLPIIPDTSVTFNDIQDGCTFRDGITYGIAYWDPLKAGEDKFVYIDADTILYPGQGYFTAQENECEFTIQGYKFTIDRVGYLGTDNIYDDWNMIGAPSDEINNFDLVEGSCNVVSGPWGFDAPSYQFVRTQKLQPGKAYFAKTTSDCNLG